MPAGRVQEHPGPGRVPLRAFGSGPAVGRQPQVAVESCCALGIRLASRLSVPHSADDICAAAGRAASSGTDEQQQTTGQQRPGQFRKGLTTRHDFGTLQQSRAVREAFKSGPNCAILPGPCIRSVALLLTVVMVLANAFFVAAEFAFVKIRPTRLQELVKQGNTRARLLLGITKQLGPYLSASQLGITVASLSLGWLGEPAVARLLRPLLSGLRRRLRRHRSHAGHRDQPDRSSPSCTP